MKYQTKIYVEEWVKTRELGIQAIITRQEKKGNYKIVFLVTIC
jgi:hypothetical protein